MNIIGSVEGINISHEKGTMKQPIPNGEFKVDHGLVGDAHAGNWHRQISLLGVESIDKMIALGAKDLTYGNFAENLTTKGVILFELPVGTKLQIGDTLHEVTQIGKKCHKGCEIQALVGDCVMPREGIFTKILKSGTIEVGDSIYLVD